MALDAENLRDQEWYSFVIRTPDGRGTITYRCARFLGYNEWRYPYSDSDEVLKQAIVWNADSEPHLDAFNLSRIKTISPCTRPPE